MRLGKSVAIHAIYCPIFDLEIKNLIKQGLNK